MAEYNIKKFFPADWQKRRECREILQKTRLDEESGDYMEAVNRARYERAAAHIEEVYLDRLSSIEAEYRERKAEILRLRQALNQLENRLDEEGEEDWDDEI